MVDMWEQNYILWTSNFGTVKIKFGMGNWLSPHTYRLYGILVITINILALLMIYEFVKFTVKVYNVISEWSLNSVFF